MYRPARLTPNKKIEGVILMANRNKNTDKMREKQLEHIFLMALRRVGGLALKFVSPGFSGVPDRLVLIPDGKVAFVEVKAPGQHPRPLQTARHRQLRQLGFKVYVLDDPQQIPEIIKDIGGDND